MVSSVMISWIWILVRVDFDIIKHLGLPIEMRWITLFLKFSGFSFWMGHCSTYWVLI